MSHHVNNIYTRSWHCTICLGLHCTIPNFTLFSLPHPFHNGNKSGHGSPSAGYWVESRGSKNNVKIQAIQQPVTQVAKKVETRPAKKSDDVKACSFWSLSLQYASSFAASFFVSTCWKNFAKNLSVDGLHLKMKSIISPCWGGEFTCSITQLNVILTFNLDKLPPDMMVFCVEWACKSVRWEWHSYFWLLKTDSMMHTTPFQTDSPWMPTSTSLQRGNANTYFGGWGSQLFFLNIVVGWFKKNLSS